MIDFDAIKRAHPIADIIGGAIDLKKVGREFHGLCPFHNERTPSFQVVPDKEFAHCQGCGWHGDVVDFVAAYKKCDTGEAIKILVGDDGLAEQSDEDKRARKEALAARDAAQLKSSAEATAKAAKQWDEAQPADPHHPYLTRKGVPAWQLRETTSGALLLPVYDSSGNIQSTQTISDDGDKRFMPGAPMGLGRMNIGIYMGRTIICEGYATGASIFEACPEQVSIAFSLGNMEKLAREYHAAGQHFMLASDTGVAAQKMAALGAELGVPVVYPRADMPDGGSDFNDQAAAFGTASVAEDIRGAMRAFADLAKLEQEEEAAHSAPFDLFGDFTPPDLPVGILPPFIEDWARKNAAISGTDPAGWALGALATSAGAIPDKVRLRVHPYEGWTESARIWVSLVGLPSTKKSLVAGSAVKPLKALNTEAVLENNKKLAEWQDDGGTKSGDPKPKLTRFTIEDVNAAASQAIFADNPNGLMLFRDEMSGFFLSMEGNSGSAADRPFWLEAYNGGAYSVDRVGRGSITIESLSVSMLGGIQPDKIRSIFKGGDDDGLIQRIIPIILKQSAKGTPAPPPEENELYGQMIKRFTNIKAARDLESNFLGNGKLVFDEGAQRIQDGVEDRCMAFYPIEQENPKLASHIGKYTGLFARLCVIFHCIENAFEDKIARTITQDTAERVSRFIFDYLMRHAFSFYSDLVGDVEGSEQIQKLAGYILTRKPETLTVRDVQRSTGGKSGLTTLEAMDACERLESLGWLVSDGTNRAKKPTFKVADEVYSMFEKQAENEALRRQKAKEVFAEIGRAKQKEG